MNMAEGGLSWTDVLLVCSYYGYNRYQQGLGKGPLFKRKWSKKQAMCLFDVAANTSNLYFQTEVRRVMRRWRQVAYHGSPSTESAALCDLLSPPHQVLKIKSPGMTDRPQFMDEQLPSVTNDQGDEGGNVQPKIQACLKDDTDAQLLDGYLTYVATNLVAPEFKKRVLSHDGGLIAVRKVS